MSEKLLTNEQMAMVVNGIISRAKLGRGLGERFDGDRDYYESFGYKENLTYSDFWEMYKRNDIASRIVEAPCDDTWKEDPTVTLKEGDKEKFDKQWREIVNDKKLFNYLRRVDILSGIGRYGVLVLGLKTTSGSNLTKDPIESADELMYLSSYSEDRAKINTVEDDPQNEKFGLVKSYDLTQVVDNKNISLTIDSSRTIHVAEGLLEDEIYGLPRLERMMNRLEDLVKIVGGSAEMFWLGARPGYNFNLDPEITLTDTQKNEMKDEIDDFMNGIRRALRLKGVDAQSLDMQVSSPKEHFEVQIDLISAASIIPKRILLGSERGEMASSQDENNWNKYIDNRKQSYAGPMILMPAIERFQNLGLLERGEVEIAWPRSFQLSQKDVAEIAQKRFAALKNYTSAPEADLVLPPEYALAEMFGYSPEKIKEIMERVEEQMDEYDREAVDDERKADEAERLIRKQQEQQDQRDALE